MKLHLVAGARPNFMKIAPLWRKLAPHPIVRPSFVHTAQHHDNVMSSVIWGELGLPDPDHVLDWRTSAIHGPLAGMMGAYERLCKTDRPDMVLVVGDVNSSLAAALVAAEMDIPLIHLEAGLRCLDPTMCEEKNRIAIDHKADLLLTSSADANDNLLAEGIADNRIQQVGNIMIDTLMMMQGAISSRQSASRFGLVKCGYVLVTLHRQTNVDDPLMLDRICDALIELAEHHPVCFPLHPRTEKRLVETGLIDTLKTAGVRTLPALGYLDFASLMKDAGLVITDSGGVQEETSFLGIGCLTLRPSTERPITIEQGTNRLVSIETLVRTALDTFDEMFRPASIPLWDGQTADRVVRALEQSGAKQFYFRNRVGECS